MKTKLVVAVAIGSSLVLAGAASAAEKELSKSEVPKAVIESFEKAHPSAGDVEFEEEAFQGKTAYEVEYQENGKEYELVYSADGTLLEKEEDIDPKTLPEAIVAAVTKAHPGATIKEAEKKMKPDGTITGYEVEIEQAGKEIELELDVNGRILETEPG
jgi:uncharacterized membrane protein YkoI